MQLGFPHSGGHLSGSNKHLSPRTSISRRVLLVSLIFILFFLLLQGLASLAKTRPEESLQWKGQQKEGCHGRNTKRSLWFHGWPAKHGGKVWGAPQSQREGRKESKLVDMAVRANEPEQQSNGEKRNRQEKKSHPTSSCAGTNSCPSDNRRQDRDEAQTVVVPLPSQTQITCSLSFQIFASSYNSITIVYACSALHLEHQSLSV